MKSENNIYKFFDLEEEKIDDLSVVLNQLIGDLRSSGWEVRIPKYEPKDIYRLYDKNKCSFAGELETNAGIIRVVDDNLAKYLDTYKTY